MTARCPEPLCTASGITRLLQGRVAPFRKNYPPFFAHTDSCARPNPSRRLRLSPYTADLCRLLSVPAGRWPFPTLDLRVFSWMLGPVPRRSREVHLLVSSLTTSAFPEKRERVGEPQNRPLSDFRAGAFLAVVVIPNVLASKFACHPGRSHRCSRWLSYSLPQARSHIRLWTWGLFRRCPSRLFRLQGSRGVSFRAEHMSLPPCASDMLAVRFRAIDGRGLSPH